MPTTISGTSPNVRDPANQAIQAGNESMAQGGAQMTAIMGNLAQSLQAQSMSIMQAFAKQQKQADADKQLWAQSLSRTFENMGTQIGNAYERKKERRENMADAIALKRVGAGIEERAQKDAEARQAARQDLVARDQADTESRTQKLMANLQAVQRQEREADLLLQDLDEAFKAEEAKIGTPGYNDKNFRDLGQLRLDIRRWQATYGDMGEEALARINAYAAGDASALAAQRRGEPVERPDAPIIEVPPTNFMSDETADHLAVWLSSQGPMVSADEVKSNGFHSAAALAQSLALDDLRTKAATEQERVRQMIEVEKEATKVNQRVQEIDEQKKFFRESLEPSAADAVKSSIQNVIYNLASKAEEIQKGSNPSTTSAPAVGGKPLGPYETMYAPLQDKKPTGGAVIGQRAVFDEYMKLMSGGNQQKLDYIAKLDRGEHAVMSDIDAPLAYWYETAADLYRANYASVLSSLRDSKEFKTQLDKAGLGFGYYGKDPKLERVAQQMWIANGEVAADVPRLLETQGFIKNWKAIQTNMKNASEYHRAHPELLGLNGPAVTGELPSESESRYGPVPTPETYTGYGLRRLKEMNPGLYKRTIESLRTGNLGREYEMYRKAFGSRTALEKTEMGTNVGAATGSLVKQAATGPQAPPQRPQPQMGPPPTMAPQGPSPQGPQGPQPPQPPGPPMMPGQPQDPMMPNTGGL